MAFSKTIQMYIFDDNPNGRIMCELSNRYLFSFWKERR